MPRQRRVHVAGHGPEVLPHHPGPMTMGLETDDGVELVGRIAHVGAVGRGPRARDPEQPVQTHHVVEPHRRRVRHLVRETRPEVRVPILPRRLRVRRRGAPVLTVREQWIGRRAERGAAGEEGGMAPDVEPVRMHAHRHVEIETDSPRAGVPGRFRDARQARLGRAARLLKFRRRRLGDARDAEDVHRDLPVAQEVLHQLELLRVAVHEGQRRVGAGEAVRANEAVPRRRVVGRNERHVAVAAGLGRRRVVERTRALPGDAGRLPVVVLVEAPDPAVLVDREVEVHLVARRAELGALLGVKRLQEGLPVRARREMGGRVVRPLEQRVLARGEIVQGRVLDHEVALAHRAADVDDGVAGRAAEAGLRLRRVDLLADRPVEAPVEEHGVVVAAGAPLGRLGADDVLHVLDRLAVPLVVERRKMVRRRVPLLVDVLVAAPARLARKEEVRRNDSVDVGVRRRREERAVGPRPFLLHRRRGRRGVDDAVRAAPLGLRRAADERRRDRGQECDGEAGTQRPYRGAAPGQRVARC